MSELDLTIWGEDGAPAVLVHGAFATGAGEWELQRPLAEEGFRLVVPDRRGYGNSPAIRGEDFLRDADDIAELLGTGAHLVGHSYGGLGAMVAAARRPESVLSLALLEPPAFAVVPHDDAVRAMTEDLREVFDADLPDDEWLLRFLAAVGTDPAALPAGMLEEVAPLVPLVRNQRRPWDGGAPTADLAPAAYPKLVVSGAHNDAFEAVCAELARQIGARHIQIAGAGHEIQLATPSINRALLDLWRGSDPASAPKTAPGRPSDRG